MAGGAGPLQRRRLAGELSRADIEGRLAAAVTAWRDEPSRPASTPWTLPRPRYRPWRMCKGCKASIRQPRAGRPRVWCSSACQWRTTRDRAVDAARNRQRWAQLPESAKEQRRVAMRARWAALSAQERAELAAQRRQRRPAGSGGLMSALPVEDAPRAPSGATPPGQWRPTDPSRPRTPKQRKRELRKDRHRRIMERAQCDPTLTHTAVRVLDVLMKHSDDTAARVWPKMITLAIPIGIALHSARRSVAELEAAGYVLRYMRPIDGSMNLSNMYYFREPAGSILQHRPNQRRRPRMRSSHRGTLRPPEPPRGLENPLQRGPRSPAPRSVSPHGDATSRRAPRRQLNHPPSSPYQRTLLSMTPNAKQPPPPCNRPVRSSTPCAPNTGGLRSGGPRAEEEVRARGPVTGKRDSDMASGAELRVDRRMVGHTPMTGVLGHGVEHPCSHLHHPAILDSNPRRRSTTRGCPRPSCSRAPRCPRATAIRPCEPTLTSTCSSRRRNPGVGRDPSAPRLPGPFARGQGHSAQASGGGRAFPASGIGIRYRRSPRLLVHRASRSGVHV